MPPSYYFNLNPDAPMFGILEREKPEWWTIICKDHDLYINIRKQNHINVYYNGASVMELYYPNKKLAALIHPKYLDSDWNAKPKEYYKTQPEKIVADLKRIKNNINNVYKKGKNNNEGGCEKEIQGRLYINGEYIDTEYSFVYEDPRLIIRIDLTTIREDGMIEFVELKRISDNRLLKKEDSEKEPEILKQMSDYNRFINDYRQDIEEYNKKIQKIMRSIGVNNPLAYREIKGVSSQARLLFAGYANGDPNHVRRRERVERIKELLDANNIVSNINEI